MKQPCTVRLRQTRQIIPLEYLFAALESHRRDDPWEELVYSDREEPFSVREWEEEAPSLGEEDWEEPEEKAVSETEFFGRGIFSNEKDGSRRISYESGEGEESVLNTFCLSPTGMLILVRRAREKFCLIFEKGARHLCDYGASGGVSVTVHTHLLEWDFKEDGGRLTVEYSVEVRGSCTEYNRLDLTVDFDSHESADSNKA